jgi:hypothetical protein
MEQLIEVLSQRDAQIVERQKYLEQFIEEYKELQDERQHIAALLAKHRAPSTNPPSPHQASHQKNILIDHSANIQISTKTKPRQSPGETEKHIDYILSRGETHSIISLIRRMDEILGVKHSDSTVGVVLRRGLDNGKYRRDGSQWSMVLGQPQLSGQPHEHMTASRAEEEGINPESNPTHNHEQQLWYDGTQKNAVVPVLPAEDIQTP